MMKRDDAEVELTKRLVLVSDVMFSHLVQAATPVNAHIALDSATKTVTGGALWYEETLPPETLLYVPLVAVKARRKESALDAAAAVLLDRAVDRLPLSGRGRARVLRVAATIAALAGSSGVGAEHVAEALSYRMPRELEAG